MENKQYLKYHSLTPNLVNLMAFLASVNSVESDNSEKYFSGIVKFCHTFLLSWLSFLICGCSLFGISPVASILWLKTVL